MLPLPADAAAGCSQSGQVSLYTATLPTSSRKFANGFMLPIASPQSERYTRIAL